jgi:hypothetical protein
MALFQQQQQSTATAVYSVEVDAPDSWGMRMDVALQAVQDLQSGCHFCTAGQLPARL